MPFFLIFVQIFFLILKSNAQTTAKPLVCINVQLTESPGPSVNGKSVATKNTVIATVESKATGLYIKNDTGNSNKFTIDSKGTVTTAQDLDREVADSYTLLIGASSAGNEACIKIALLDVNDNAPAIRTVPDPLIIPNSLNKGQALGQIVVSDADSTPNGPPFNVTMFDDGPLNVTQNIYLKQQLKDPNAYMLYTSSQMLINDSFAITFMVSDSGTPPQSTNMTITVNVGDPRDFNTTTLSSTTTDVPINAGIILHAGILQLFAVTLILN